MVEAKTEILALAQPAHRRAKLSSRLASRMLAWRAGRTGLRRSFAPTHPDPIEKW
jgi:hypothetical protein